MNSNKNNEKIQKLISFLERYWDSDFDIEINPKEFPTKILIFSVDYCDNYWSSGKWYFSGKRCLVPPSDIYKKYKKFSDKIDEIGLYYKCLTLEQAKEIVKLVFGSRKTDYYELEMFLRNLE